MNNFWTEQEDDHLRRHYGEWSAAQIGQYINRSKDAVLHRADRLGLRDADRAAREAAKWTPEHDEYLRANYHKLSARQIGDVLGKTKNSVIGRANRLKLQRSHRPAIQPWSEIQVKREVPMAGTYRQSGCQWINGDPLRGDHTYCGEPLKEGSRFSYCAKHHKIVFRAPTRKPRQRFELRPAGVFK